MVRLIAYLLTIALFAAGLSWLADRPGTLQVVWQGYDIETSVFRAVVLLAAAVASIVFLLSVLRAIWNSPAVIGHRIVRRRQKKGRRHTCRIPRPSSSFRFLANNDREILNEKTHRSGGFFR